MISKKEKQKNTFEKIYEVIKTMASKPSGLIGLTILVFHVLLAITSPLYVPYDYKAIDPSLMLNPPSSEFWFGTDSLGRDVFTRTILGGRTALTVTFFGSLIALLWGGSLGIFCGLVGGKIDDVVMRIIDAFLSIPWILAMLLIVSLLGTTTLVLIPALGFFYGKGIVRVARAATHDVIAKDFIVSARARSSSTSFLQELSFIPRSPTKQHLLAIFSPNYLFDFLTIQLDLPQFAQLLNLFCGLDDKAENLGVPAGNAWVVPGWDHKGNFEKFSEKGLDV